MRKPLPFFPKTSYAYFSTADERKKASAANLCWNDGWNTKGEVRKFGIYFGTELPIGDCFKSLAEAFFGAVAFRSEKPAGKRKNK